MSRLSKWGRASACVVLVLVSACGTIQSGSGDPGKASGKVDDGTGTGKNAKDPGNATFKPVSKDVVMKSPGPLKGAMLSSDVLVYSQNSLDKSTIAKIKAIKGVDAVEPMSMGSFFVAERQVTYAAVHPDTFRRFASPGTAATQAVWDRVAGGEIAVRVIRACRELGIAESAIVSTGAITRRNPLTRLATLAADTTFVTAAATVAVLSASVATVLGALDTSRAITYTTIGLSMLMPIFALLLVSWPHDRRRLQATAAATLATLAVITLGVASSDGDVHLSGEQIIAMLATSAAFTSAATALPARANRY